ncbi:MAG: NAD(P)/FAD-dependent oxidoreductase, partial [Candidatus Thorarchaeota archaeon]|jgi:geranylgeranyl reductase family protein
LHDLIVVGGGPAGAACARKAAEEGLDVLLLERAVHPRRKLCGGALTRRIAKHLDPDYLKVVENRVSIAKIISPSGQQILAPNNDIDISMVKRQRFDNYMIEKARSAGAEIIQDARVVAVEQLRSNIRVLTEGNSYRGHLLVGADGVNGIVARSTDIRSKWPSDSVALCIQADVPLDAENISQIMSVQESETLTLEIYLGVSEWGYAWSFPKKDELSIGIGCRMDKVRSLRAAWKSFLEHCEMNKGLKLDTSTKSAFRIPFSPKIGRITTRRTMLVGDAAGLVSSLTGEGIYYAVRSGILAAEVACETVEMKSPLHVNVYEHRIKQTLIPELKAADFIARILFKSRNNTEEICKVLTKDSELKTLFINLLAATEPASELRNAITKRMLRHHTLQSLKLVV